MSLYTKFNIAFGVLTLITALCSSQRKTKLLLKVSLLMSFLSFPWNYFAVSEKVWIHPVDPGLRIYGVPLNDIILVFSCTFLASNLLLVDKGSDSKAKREG